MHSAVHAKYFYDIIVGNFEIDPAHVRYSLSQIMTMVNLVGHGHGIAFVPESARYTRTPGVTFLSFADFRDDVVRLHALWRPEATNPALQRVLAAIGD
jgi:DNA-binding transcriptional LysR family regulator